MELRYVRAHAGHTGNEEADELANQPHQNLEMDAKQLKILN